MALAPGRSKNGLMPHRLWHPFANMATVRGNALVIEHAEDVWLFDDAGRRYLDATASLWYANVGHGRREIVDRVADQLRRLDAYNVFSDFANPPALELADRLASLAPVDDARVFLASGGGDAIDTAAKLARGHWTLRGQPHRTHLIRRTHAYHGTHGFGTSLGGIEANVSGWGPLVPDTSGVEFDSLEALEREILRVGPDRVAAFFCEPIIGAGGVRHPPEGYIEGAADLCAEHGVLLIVDSVIVGFGRLGTWFGIERWGVRPDLVTFAKGVTSGYLPLGGVIASGDVAEPFWEGEGAAFRHGATYSGHPTCCAAALANLDILGRDGLLERGRELEGELAEVLAPLADSPNVAEVRAGLGLLGAAELAPDVLAADPDAVARVVFAAREHGVIVRPLVSAVAVSPPLTIQREQLELIGEALAHAFDSLPKGMAGRPAVSATIATVGGAVPGARQREADAAR
jgi:putrescine aminotransferase